MTYKMFCDRCNKETDRNFVNQCGTHALDGWRVEVMVSYHGEHTQGILCHKCFSQIMGIGKLEPRSYAIS